MAISRLLNRRLSGVCVTAVFAFLTITARVHAATMDVLLGGNDLRLEYPSGAVVLISFESDGKYTTSTGSSGTWTLDGEKLCTVRNSDNVSGCGRLPLGKSPGDVWTSTDANNVDVIASIVPRH